MAKKKVPNDRVSHEQLGQMLQNIYESGYINRNTMYKMSFLKGVISGVGGVVGATIVIGLLLWVLSLFDQTPVVGPLFDNIQETIQSKSQ
jgi:hypothetical protein